MQKTIEKLLELLIKHKEEFGNYTLKVHRSCLSLSLRVDGVENNSELFIYIGSLLTHLKLERYIKEKSIATMGDSILVNLDF